MKVDIIRTNRNIKFKANFFKVEKYGQCSGIYVCTDNSENLGSQPVLETHKKTNSNGLRREILYDRM